MSGLNLTLKIWRQKDAKTKGQFETVKSALSSSTVCRTVLTMRPPLASFTCASSRMATPS